MGRLTAIKSIPSKTWGVLRLIWHELIIPIEVIKVNCKIVAKEIEKSDFEALNHDTLRSLIKDEWTRAKELDDKLQRLAAALSVSVTIGGLVGSTMLQDLAIVWIKYVVGGLFLVATIYLIAGVLIGFTGLKPKPRYGHGAAFLRISKENNDAAKQELVEAAASFQRDNIKRANEATAAVASIRNGVVTFALALLVSMAAWIIGT